MILEWYAYNYQEKKITDINNLNVTDSPVDCNTSATIDIFGSGITYIILSSSN